MVSYSCLALALRGLYGGLVVRGRMDAVSRVSWQLEWVRGSEVGSEAWYWW
jgi:hypothetical protein